MVTEGQHDRAVEYLIGQLVKMEIEHAAVKSAVLHAFHGKGGGFFKRSIGWMLTAEKRGFDALILLIDRDREPERVEQINMAQNFAQLALRRALGVAIESFDAWVLADERALTRVLGRSVDAQKSPESIRRPKEVCEQLGILQRDQYQEVCRTLDIELLIRRCPGGFAPFAQRVSDLKR